MPRFRFGLLFLFAISLALLPASTLAPVMAGGVGIAKIILKGEALPSLGYAYSLSPADVNNSGLTVFYAKGTAGGACGVFAGTSGGGPPTAVVIDGYTPPEGPLSMCGSLGEAPLTNGGGQVAFAANINMAGSPRAIYVSPAPDSAIKVVMQNQTAPDGGAFGVPTLLDFNDDGDVLFAADVNGISCSSLPCSGIFVATGGPPTYTITKVVLEGDTIPGSAGGGTVTAVGDASMNNSGAVAFQASVSGGTKGTQGIFLVSGTGTTTTTTWVVGQGDQWKLGEAYSGGEPNHAQKRFVDTFTSVSGPRVNDVAQVSYYATTAGGEEGYFLGTPGSDYEQAKQATKDDPSVLGVDGFSCGLGLGGRHHMGDDGTVITPGCGGDPISGVLVFPYFHKVAIQHEVIPGTTTGQTYEGFTLPAMSGSGEEPGEKKVAFKADVSSSGSCPAPCQGVFGGTIIIADADGDGLLDAWEQQAGWDYNNDGTVDLNLWNLGARPDHKDIFVEVDYMDCTVAGGDCGDNHNHKPTAAIIEDGVVGQTCDDGIDNGGVDGLTDTNDPDCAVVAAFDNAPVNNPDGNTGIHLHVLVDEKLSHRRFMNFAGSLLEDPTAASPGPCNDGLDNGFDGQIDGADSDCTGALLEEDPDSATPGSCNDLIDNGGDGACDLGACPGKPPDPDCSPTIADFDNVKSFGTEDDRTDYEDDPGPGSGPCDDDIDNDGDGKVDEKDPDCNSKNILAAKTRVFHYSIFGHSPYPDNTTTPLWEDTISGYGEMPGNDFMVTLGEWDFTADEQEGTFMHELGHNLGLDHSGGDSMNYKPNYLSVMNYTFQMTNIVANRPLDYSHWVLPPQDNEDGQGANTCNDGLDNGSDGVADQGLDTDADTVLEVLPDLDCAGALMEPLPVEDPGMNPGPCDDGKDNGNDGKTDELDDDCQWGLDEGRGIDSNMPPAGLASLTTAFTYLRVSAGGQEDCPFATVAAVGNIDWDMNGIYTGISLDSPSSPSANTGAGISDPDPGPSPPLNGLCRNMTSVLDGYNDWPNLMYVKGFALSVDFSVNDHFTPHPEPAQMAQPDTDSDDIADIADNCPNDANSGQEDSDGDHVGNVCDNCPSVWNLSQVDGDTDGYGDACDNCPAVSNPTQQNSDTDGYGDACDNCLAVSNPTQQNSDTDSYGDACDYCLHVSNSGQENHDTDGAGDACDCDDDNDKTPDGQELRDGTDPLDVLDFNAPDTADSDNDKGLNWEEDWSGTDPFDPCGDDCNTSHTDDAWAYDINIDCWCNSSDILAFPANVRMPAQLGVEPTYKCRYDLTGDNWINSSDILAFPQRIAMPKQCTNP